ncbi:hypothetical protein T484DRAFT_1799877, partial [Baffinella frigidus]
VASAPGVLLLADTEDGKVDWVNDLAPGVLLLADTEDGKVDWVNDLGRILLSAAIRRAGWQYEAVFDRFDRDQDGRAGWQYEAVFDRFDRDQDGSLDSDEMVDAMLEVIPGMEKRASLDQDEMVDAMLEVIPGMEKRAALALFRDLDSDGDGKVQKSEFIKGLANLG